MIQYGRYMSCMHMTNVHRAREDMWMLEQALLQLKVQHRQVFVLRHVENYSVQETAQILKWSTSKVTTTDQRAIQKLRALLGGDLAHEEA